VSSGHREEGEEEKRWERRAKTKRVCSKHRGVDERQDRRAETKRANSKRTDKVRSK
jgi:hypothetical protein